MIDLTPVCNGLIALAAALLTAFVIPWIRVKTSAQDRAEMLEWVDIAVAAAQQLYHGLEGAQRKEYVRNFLNARGYDVTEKEIDNAIEAAVLKLHKEMEAAA